MTKLININALICFQNSGNGNESGYFLLNSIEQLDLQYTKWIGNFMFPVFTKRALLDRIWFEIRTTVLSFKRHLCWCKPICCLSDPNEQKNTNGKLTGKLVKANPLFFIAKHVEEKVKDGTLAEEGTQVMLRDLLFWAVFTNRIDMAKVLILHIRPRICAALVCATILKNRALKTPASDKCHLYKQQANDFEVYATDCIDACYSKSERKACELMIREVPLFGDITCMQVKSF